MRGKKKYHKKSDLQDKFSIFKEIVSTPSLILGIIVIFFGYQIFINHESHKKSIDNNTKAMYKITSVLDNISSTCCANKVTREKVQHNIKKHIKKHIYDEIDELDNE